MKRVSFVAAVALLLGMSVRAQVVLHPTAEGSSIGKLQADSIFFLYADSAFGEEYFGGAAGECIRVFLGLAVAGQLGASVPVCVHRQGDGKSGGDRSYGASF